MKKYKIRFNSPLWWIGQFGVVLMVAAAVVVGLAVTS